jgi:hypothetical protein
MRRLRQVCVHMLQYPCAATIMISFVCEVWASPDPIVSPIDASAFKAGMRIDTSGFIYSGLPFEMIIGTWMW